jgi:phospholipase/carboxylesterase
MKEMSTSLAYHALFPKHSTAQKHPTVIMLHGRGADEEDLLGLVQYLDERLMALSVRAPFLFQWGGGYAWYDIEEVGKVDKEMFKSSYDKLVTFVQDSLQHYPIDPKYLFLLGFSMGTVMAYSLALSKPDLFRGVVANSGYVPEATHLQFQWDKLSNTDFFIAHGDLDPVIPVSFARKAKELFAASNAQLTYKEYPMAHQISEESMTDFARWIVLHLKKRDPGSHLA